MKTPRPVIQPALAPSAPPEPVAEANVAEQRRQERVAADRRRDIRVTWLLFGVIFVLTLGFAALNFWVNHRGAPAPCSLSFATSDHAPARYRLSMEWEGEGFHPEVTLADGSPLPVLLDAEQPCQLTFHVAPATRGREHDGALVLRRETGASDLPEERRIPVHLAVNGFWSNFHVLRNWVIVGAGLYLVTWILCVVAFPAPSGRLEIFRYGSTLRPGGAHGTANVRVPLRLRPVAWIAPWLRSEIPLSKALRRAWRGRIPPGQIIFMGKELPYLFTPPRRQTGLWRRSRGTGTPDPAAPGQPVRPVESFLNSEFVFIHPADQKPRGIRYHR